MIARIIWATAVLAVLAAVPAFGESVVGRNTNAVGPFPDGFYRGIPHYQDNEPHCDRNPLLEGNIICLVNGYNGADDLIGDGWPKILETQDNARTWQSRFATGSLADDASSLGLGFGADPIMVCWPGGCGGFFIASNRAEGGGSGGGVYMQLLPELNVETGFRHYSEQGPRTVQLGTGDNFLDKIDAVFIVDEQNPGTVDLSIDIEKGNSVTETIQRTWPKGRLIVVYASINSSSQNVRIFSTYSDDFGANWSPPKQVANSTGLDTGVAVAAIRDTVVYAYRQFADDAGDQTDAVFAAVSTSLGERISKPFAIIDNLCPFDQPTLAIAATVDGNPVGLDVVASRSNNFVDISTDGDNFVIALTQRNLAPDGTCLTQPFDYPAGSRVYVTTAGSNGKNWSDPVPLAPRDSSHGPRNGHSFQLMPAVDCALGVCQAIWYDSIRDSQRNLGFLESAGNDAAADKFEQFPFLADFYLPTGTVEAPEVLQFRRTADIFTRRFTIESSGIDFEDPEPVRVTRFQLARLPSPGALDAVFEVEQLPFNVKQYKGNTASFMGDYVGLASKKVRARTGVTGPDGEPLYESNAGIDSANPLLKPSWFAYWTDTREVRGQLYSQSAEDALPFAKSPSNSAVAKLEEAEPERPDGYVEDLDRELGRVRTAEGLEDTNPGIGTCMPPSQDLPLAAGDYLPLEANLNRIKDADVYGALIGSPATAWVLNASKSFGPGRPQRAFTIAARNEEEDRGKTFRFRIMNQPVGAPLEARASWLQLPYEEFDRADTPEPLLEVDEDVGPLSSVTVALFVVSAEPINPVSVNVYEVVKNNDESEQEFLVETLTVNGALAGGDLVSINPFLPDVNVAEIHNPSVFAPTDYDPALENPQIWNPQIWNPQIWNPQIWNPQIWNPQIWNPQIWNPQIWNPQIWNPQIWNPQIWNTSVTDADELDNEEIPEPELSGLVDADGNPREPDEPVAKIDIQFGVSNDGNTTTPYTADIAVNSPLVRQRLAEGKVMAQLIVWEDARLDSFQACNPDPTAGQLRVIAAVNNPDLLNLKVPDIINNRFGSITYYLEPDDELQITLRLIALEAVAREIAPELTINPISFVVTSQAANTGEDSLSPSDEEQVISDQIPPTISVNRATPVELTAVAQPDAQGNLQVGAVLPADLVTASKGEFEQSLDVNCTSSTAGSVELGQFAAVGLGQSTLTCSATAANGVSATAEFGLDISDTTPPELSGVPENFLLERELVNGTDLSVTVQPAAAAFNAVDDLPVATDDIEGSVAVECSYPSAAGSATLAPGGIAPFDTAANPTSTVVTCSAEDSSGNSVSGSFTITVRDITPPVVDAVTDVSVAAATLGGTVVPISAPTANDAGNIVASDCTAFDPATSVVGMMTVFPIGATPVTCSATDDVQNTGTTSFTVTVFDTTPPLFDTTVDDFTVEANAIGGANVTFTAPTASDLDAAVPVSCDADPAGAFFPIGATTVTCTATDAQGNVATDTFVVTVADTTPPVLTVPGDITALFGATVTFEATATDNADADPIVTCSPPSGTVFPLGTTTVDCTATDDAGLTDTGSFTVNIVLGGTSSLSSNKKSVNAGAVASFDWVWEDYLGNPVDVGTGNQDVEARPGNCPSTADDVLDEDPGSSDIRQQADGQWTFNWQTVDANGDPIAAGTYCFSVVLLTTDPNQTQSTEIRVR